MNKKFSLSILLIILLSNFPPGLTQDTVIFYDSFEEWGLYGPVGWFNSYDLALKNTTEIKYSGANGVLIDKITGNSDTYISMMNSINVTALQSYRATLHVWDSSNNFSLQLLAIIYTSNQTVITVQKSNISINTDSWQNLIVDFSIPTFGEYLKYQIDVPVSYLVGIDGILAFDDLSMEPIPSSGINSYVFNLFISVTGLVLITLIEIINLTFFYKIINFR